MRLGAPSMRPALCHGDCTRCKYDRFTCPKNNPLQLAAGADVDYTSQGDSDSYYSHMHDGWWG
jgi:hypothetical protein